MMDSRVQDLLANIDDFKQLVTNVEKCADDNLHLWLLDGWTLVTSSSRAGMFMVRGDFGLNPTDHSAPAIYEEGIRELMRGFLGTKIHRVDLTEFKSELSKARKAKEEYYPVGIRLGDIEYAYDFKRLARLLTKLDVTGVRVGILSEGPLYLDGGWWKLSLMRMVNYFLKMEETPRITLGPKPEPVDTMSFIEALSS